MKIEKEKGCISCSESKTCANAFHEAAKGCAKYDHFEKIEIDIPKTDYYKSFLGADIIKTGIDSGIVKLVKNPNADRGTVCQIGDSWFYFGGLTAEEEDPEEFIQNADTDEVADDISYALLDLWNSSEGEDEALYYACFLQEHVSEEEKNEIKARNTLKDAISSYCTIAVRTGKCDPDGCEFCPIGQAYEKVAGAE